MKPHQRKRIVILKERKRRIITQTYEVNMDKKKMLEEMHRMLLAKQYVINLIKVLLLPDTLIVLPTK